MSIATFLDRARRDLIQLNATRRVLSRLNHVVKHPQETAADVIEKWAIKTPEAIAILFENRRYSFRDYDRAGNQYARWAEAQGIRRGEPVALLMENRPEYLFAMLGLAKIGAVLSLINTNLRGAGLAHSLKVAGVRHLILGAELAEAWASVEPLLNDKPQVWTTGGMIAGTHDLDVELSCQSPEPLSGAARTGLTIHDLYLQVFTSGTTGLPKAANISHRRYFTIAGSFQAMFNAKARDRMYIVLPLYHSSGGIAAVGAALNVGGSVVLRRRFSVSQFWDDCAKYEATLFQYIGELCRYLINAPENPSERAHKIRCIVGNGLRADIWEAFKTRFAIPQIVEFYGSTEGNVSLFNADGKVGSVGHVVPILRSLFKYKIVKFDVETGTYLRGPDGFCIECAPGEAGEILGKIEDDPKRATGRFEGYSDKQATQQKILRDAFEKGDAWFRTGDLLKRDEEGYYYFVDRIGDTFRWKGENVATGEVAQVVSSFPGVYEANIYGVHVPGTEGRAGMAAIAVDPTIDLMGLHRHVEKCLPVYARPLFLRLQGAIDATGTFKHKKAELVEEGFDPGRIHDQLYFDHPKLRGYVPLDPALYEEIRSGQVRL